MKTIAMYRPGTFQNALSDFDRYFDSFFGDSLLTSVDRVCNHQPAVDIRETETAYVMEMDLPGFDEKNIEVNIDGSNLSVASRQESVKEEKDQKEGDESSAKNNGTFLLRERRSSSFNRIFKLPENADPGTVNAAFKNGILSLEIKKRAEAQRRSIQINAA